MHATDATETLHAVPTAAADEPLSTGTGPTERASPEVARQRVRDSLDAIEADERALDAILYDVGGDISEEDAGAAIDEWLDEVTERREAKLNGYARYLSLLHTRASAKRAEENRLAARRRTETSRIDWLEGRLLAYVRRRGMPIKGKETRKVETDLYTFTETMNGGKRGLDYLVGYDALPEELRETTVTIRLRGTGQDAAREKIEEMLAESGAVLEASIAPIETAVRLELEWAEEEAAKAAAAEGAGAEEEQEKPWSKILRMARLRPRESSLRIR